MTRRTCAIVVSLALSVLVPLAGPARADSPTVTSVTVVLPDPVVAAQRNTVVDVLATDANGEPVPGVTVALSSSDTGQAFDRPGYFDGSYQFGLTTSSTLGASTITATVRSGGADVSGTAILTTVKPIGRVQVDVPTSTLLTGSTAPVTVHTFDGVTGEPTDLATGPNAGTITWTVNGRQSFEPPSRVSTGVYTVLMHAGGVHGSTKIRATVKQRASDAAGTSSDTAAVTQAVNVTPVTLVLDRNRVRANWVDTTGYTVTVTAADPTLPVALTVYADMGPVSEPTKQPNGTYTGTVLASPQSGDDTVTARISSESPAVTSTASLTRAALVAPTVTATRTPAAPGWSNRPVVVTFTCTPGSAPLTRPCPPPAVLDHDGRGQVAGTEVVNDDELSAYGEVRGIDVDLTPPVGGVAGLGKGSIYPKGYHLHPRCVGFDQLSGVVSCTLTTTRVKRPKIFAMVTTATIIDAAGNTAYASVDYGIRRRK